MASTCKPTPSQYFNILYYVGLVIALYFCTLWLIIFLSLLSKKKKKKEDNYCVKGRRLDARTTPSLRRTSFISFFFWPRDNLANYQTKEVNNNEWHHKTQSVGFAWNGMNALRGIFLRMKVPWVIFHFPILCLFRPYQN